MHFFCLDRDNNKLEYLIILNYLQEFLMINVDASNLKIFLNNLTLYIFENLDAWKYQTSKSLVKSKKLNLNFILKIHLHLFS